MRSILTQHNRDKSNKFNKDLKTILKGNPRLYFDKIKGLFNKKGSTGLPKVLKYKNKTYIGNQVLQGFYDLSKDQSINPKRVPGNNPLPYYNIMRDVVNLEKYFLDNCDNTYIEPLTEKTYNVLLRRVARDKAQDINGLAIEHLLHAPDSVKKLEMNFTNYVMEDFSRYSTPLMSLSVSTFLYKGKNKPKDLTGSYRKITVGSLKQKIIDRDNNTNKRGK